MSVIDDCQQNLAFEQEQLFPCLGTTVVILGFPANGPHTPPIFKSFLTSCLSISVRPPGYFGVFGAPLLLPSHIPE